MSDTNTGGPAFPGVDELGEPYEGMTLRDYFAAKAMQGFCGNAANQDALPGEIAGGAYLVADAMMKAREA
jgi:hypothetical protein